MKSASGEARNTAAHGISSDLPALPAGVADIRSFLASWSLRSSEVIGGLDHPGANSIDIDMGRVIQRHFFCQEDQSSF